MHPFRIWKHVLCLSLLLLAGLPSLQSQQPAQTPPAITLENPYNTVLVHLYYLQPDSYRPDLAAQVFYTIADPEEAEKLAIRLKQVYDGLGLYVRLNTIPIDSNYVDTVRMEAVYYPFPAELPTVYLEQTRDGRWFYSSQTVSELPRIHREVYPFGVDLLINLFPQFGQEEFLGIAVWQYAGALILVVLALLLHFLLRRILRPVVARLTRSRLYPSLVPEALIWRIATGASILVLVQLVRVGFPVLQPSIGVALVVTRFLNILTAIVIMIIALRVLDVVMLYSKRYTEGTASMLDDQLVPIVKRLLQAFIIIGALLQILQYLDVNVTALIAGVSIGGLALALAAQDTVKNLIGSAMIFIDKPFQIGDWIISDGVEGGVKEVGFRTTRIQRADSSIISVPNGNIANASITNLGVRVFRLVNNTIGVMYNTPPDLLEAFIEGLRQIIVQHPKTDSEKFMVYFTEMGASSLNIVFRTPIEASDLATDWRIREELNLAIVRLAAELGVSFAFPSTSVYIESTPAEGSPESPYRTEPQAMQTSINTFMERYRRELHERYSEDTDRRIS